jgi:hypothetical protein
MKKNGWQKLHNINHWSTQINPIYIDHSLKLSTYKQLLLFVVTFIFKAHF